MYLIIIIILILLQKLTTKKCKSKKFLHNKTVIITGGTSGIGLEVAKDLAERGAKIIIASPYKEEGLKAEKYLKETTKSDKIIFKILDLGSFKSTRDFAQHILDTEKRLDLLINNAGIGGPNIESEDGINLIMQVNYIGAYLLTLSLLPLMKKTGTFAEPTRIINTASILHLIGKVNVTNWKRTDLNRVLVYGDSKLCITLFSLELSKRISKFNVVVNTVDPGLVGTSIYRTWNWFFGFIVELFLFIVFKNAKQGAQTSIFLAVDDEGKSNGRYYRNCKISSPFSKGRDEKIAKVLWDETAKLVQLTNP